MTIPGRTLHDVSKEKSGRLQVSILTDIIRFMEILWALFRVRVSMHVRKLAVRAIGHESQCPETA